MEGMIMQANKQIGFRFSKKLLWRFFLVVVFPINFWALIIWFYEFDNMAQRTNTWDAIGEGGYFLSYTLFESVVIFLVLSLLLLLFPKKWDEDTIFSGAGSVYLVLAAWFILEQARFLEFWPEGNWLIARLQIASLHTTTGRILVVVFLLSLIAPVFLSVRYKKVRPALSAFLERIGLLSILYLFLDVVGFIIVLIRII